VNRAIERKVAELAGRKSLYSTSYYGREEFYQTYGGEQYQALKSQYDPQGRFPGLYEKTCTEGR
jgi:FAD/FMN-containing dehydrogenase